MSTGTITKEVKATICDFCDIEIDTESDGYCYANLRSYDGKRGSPDNWDKYKVVHIVFSWFKKAPNNRSDYIQYDFHAECFDKLMRKFLEERS